MICEADNKTVSLHPSPAYTNKKICDVSAMSFGRAACALPVSRATEPSQEYGCIYGRIWTIEDQSGGVRQ